MMTISMSPVTQQPTRWFYDDDNIDDDDNDEDDDNIHPPNYTTTNQTMKMTRTRKMTRMRTKMTTTLMMSWPFNETLLGWKKTIKCKLVFAIYSNHLETTNNDNWLWYDQQQLQRWAKRTNDDDQQRRTMKTATTNNEENQWQRWGMQFACLWQNC